MNKGRFYSLIRQFFKRNHRIKREFMSLDSLCHSIRYEFNDKTLLLQAMTHRSSLIVDAASQSNERLEFLGDAVIGWLVTDALYRKFPECNEGELTRVKSMIVSREALADQARRINLGQYLILGRGEERSGGRSRRSNLANGFEALIGAIYLDGGLEKVRGIIERHLVSDAGRLMSTKYHHNYKSWLLELSQAQFKCSPKYHVLRESGPDHCKEFHVEVIINGKTEGKGQGASKKKAEQAAAREALIKLGILNNLNT
jgi:ribonuclease-3